MKFKYTTLLLISFLAASCGVSEKEFVLKENRIFFLDAKEGYEYLRNSDFVQNLTNIDISLRLEEDFSDKSSAEVKEIYSNYLKEQINDWNSGEKSYLIDRLTYAYEQMEHFTPGIIPDTLYLIRSTGDQEFDSFYTIENAVIFPDIIFTSAYIFPWLPYFSNMIEKKIFHETFHIYSTNNKKDRLELYELFGFEPVTNLCLPEVIKERLITNPDDKGFNYKINLPDSASGEIKNYCLLILSKYPGWVGYKDFSARINVMLDYLDPRLLEIKNEEGKWVAETDSTEKPVTIPVNISAELQNKIAVKVNAIQSPEEICAKTYVILMQSLIENEKPENQTPAGIKIIDEFHSKIRNIKIPNG